MPKILAKLHWGHPQRGCQIVGVGSDQWFSTNLSIAQKRCKTGT